MKNPTSVALSDTLTKQELLVSSHTLTPKCIDDLNQIKKVHSNSAPLAMPILMGSKSNNKYALISDIAVAILSPYMGIS